MILKIAHFLQNSCKFRNPLDPNGLNIAYYSGLHTNFVMLFLKRTVEHHFYQHCSKRKRMFAQKNYMTKSKRVGSLIAKTCACTYNVTYY